MDKIYLLQLSEHVEVVFASFPPHHAIHRRPTMGTIRTIRQLRGARRILAPGDKRVGNQFKGVGPFPCPHFRYVVREGNEPKERHRYGVAVIWAYGSHFCDKTNLPG